METKKNKRNNIDEINKQLHENFILGLNKPTLNKYDSALIVKRYLDTEIIRKDFSLNDFCKKFNFKKEDVLELLKWNGLREDVYFKLINLGFSESDICVMLKNEDTSLNGEFLFLINRLSDFIDKNSLKSVNINKNKDKILLLRNKLSTILYKNDKD